MLKSKRRYKYCMVPRCVSTTITAPNKLFINMPKNELRKKWCIAMRRDIKLNPKLSATSVHHVCEDHFDMEKDMENYMQYKLQCASKIIMKKGVVPHIFKCQMSVPDTSKKRKCLNTITGLTDAQPTASPSTAANLVDKKKIVTKYRNRPHRPRKRSKRSKAQRRRRLKENSSKVNEEIESLSTPRSCECEHINAIMHNQEMITGNPNPLLTVMPNSAFYQSHSIKIEQSDDTDDPTSLFMAMPKSSTFQTHNIKIEQQYDTNDPEPFLIAMPSSSTLQSHNVEIEQSNSLQQFLNQNYLNDTDYQPLDVENAEKCTESITKFLATSIQPCRLVEEKSFKKMVKTLNPQYCLPEHKYFSNTAIPKLYIEAMDKLKEILTKDLSAGSNFSVTCDCSSVAGCSYMVISVHYVNTNWNSVSACLDCAYIDENPTIKNIKDAIRNKLVEWGLDLDFIVSCTSDNGASIANSIKLLNIDHVPCFVHSFAVGVKRSIEVPQIQRAIRILKSLQSDITNNWEMKKNLREAQESLLFDIKKIPSACSTGWLSTLKLCKRFLENQILISKMLQNFPETTMLKKSDIFALEHFVKVASVLKTIAKNLSRENCIESSAVLPLVCQIKTRLQIQGTCKNRLLNSLKEKFLSALMHYEKEPLQTMLRCSTFVDPRFKLNSFNESVKEIVKKKVINEIEALYESSGSLASDISKGILLERILKEIEEYIDMPKLDMDANPLQWWHQYAQQFPKLCILAKKYLCIQGSSVPSNRVFSSGENVINKNLCCISPKDAEMQIFLAYNKQILEI